MNISLAPASPGDLEASATFIVSGLTHAFPTYLEAGRAAVAEVLSTMTVQPRPGPWGAYWAVERTSGRAVGLCAFKSPPNWEGAVEIAHYTFPAMEGRGVATATATALADLAIRAGARFLTANTLPVENASGTVLRRAGFQFTGPAQDPEDGLVWSWRKPLA